jgi:hypothetical protein
MKQVLSDKYNIAWFKLAECIARGEKERALGVYRLLSHSLGDIAFANQLEGDILLFFNDINAIQKYNQAAHLYVQDARILQAAAVYEHLIELDPEDTASRKLLIDLYKQVDFFEKMHAHINTLCKIAIKLKKIKDIFYTPEQLEALLLPAMHEAYQNLFFMIFDAHILDVENMALYGKKFIDHVKNQVKIEFFLQAVKDKSTPLYNKLLENNLKEI